MGNSADASIWYGVVFDADYEFPWSFRYEEDEEGNEIEIEGTDLETWWDKRHGFDPPEIETKDGRYDFTEYRKYSKEFYNKYPLPVESGYYGSGYSWSQEYLCIPKKGASADWGNPESFNPEDLNVSEEEVQKLLDFCRDNGLEYKEGPGWFISASYG